MKLIIQIPSYNEATALPMTLAQLPRQVAGCDEVERLVIDYRSDDCTSAVARVCGVDHVVLHPSNRGLAAAFVTGLDRAIALGADIVLNTDADNQYDGRDIPVLATPNIEGSADFEVGARPIASPAHFAWITKRLQQLGGSVVRMVSANSEEDTPSGLRAMTCDVAKRLNVLNTWTNETLIQVGRGNIRVVSVPIRTNADLHPSRLVRGILDDVTKSLATICFGAGLTCARCASHCRAVSHRQGLQRGSCGTRPYLDHNHAGGGLTARDQQLRLSRARCVASHEYPGRTGKRIPGGTASGRRLGRLCAGHGAARIGLAPGIERGRRGVAAFLRCGCLRAQPTGHVSARKRAAFRITTCPWAARGSSAHRAGAGVDGLGAVTDLLRCARHRCLLAPAGTANHARVWWQHSLGLDGRWPGCAGYRGMGATRTPSAARACALLSAAARTLCAKLFPVDEPGLLDPRQDSAEGAASRSVVGGDRTVVGRRFRGVRCTSRDRRA